MYKRKGKLGNVAICENLANACVARADVHGIAINWRRGALSWRGRGLPLDTSCRRVAGRRDAGRGGVRGRGSAGVREVAVSVQSEPGPRPVPSSRLVVAERARFHHEDHLGVGLGAQPLPGGLAGGAGAGHGPAGPAPAARAATPQPPPPLRRPRRRGTRGRQRCDTPD